MFHVIADMRINDKTVIQMKNGIKVNVDVSAKNH